MRYRGVWEEFQPRARLSARLKLHVLLDAEQEFHRRHAKENVRSNSEPAQGRCSVPVIPEPGMTACRRRRLPRHGRLALRGHEAIPPPADLRENVRPRDASGAPRTADRILCR